MSIDKNAHVTIIKLSDDGSVGWVACSCGWESAPCRAVYATYILPRTCGAYLKAVCLICGDGSQQVFCSNDCAAEWTRRRYVGVTA